MVLARSVGVVEIDGEMAQASNTAMSAKRCTTGVNMRQLACCPRIAAGERSETYTARSSFLGESVEVRSSESMVAALLSASMTWSASRHRFICTSCTLTTLRASERTLAESSMVASRRCREDGRPEASLRK